jgi:hypothetical protein
MHLPCYKGENSIEENHQRQEPRDCIKREIHPIIGYPTLEHKDIQYQLCYVCDGE